MSFFATVLSLLVSFFSFVRGQKDRRIGSDEQIIKDFEAKTKAQDAMAEADAQAPRNTDQLKDRLNKGEL